MSLHLLPEQNGAKQLVTVDLAEAGALMSTAAKEIESLRRELEDERRQSAILRKTAERITEDLAVAHAAADTFRDHVIESLGVDVAASLYSGNQKAARAALVKKLGAVIGEMLENAERYHFDFGGRWMSLYAALNTHCYLDGIHAAAGAFIAATSLDPLGPRENCSDSDCRKPIEDGCVCEVSA